MSWLTRWRRDDAAASEAENEALLERARALPRRVEPQRDLWAGIRHRIEAPEEAPAPTGWRGSLQVPLWAATALTLVLVATSVGTGLWLGSPSLSLDDPEAVRALADSLRSRDGAGEVRTSLLALLEERRSQLPPELVVSLEQNLTEIDRAIAEIHLALEEHPNSPTLQFLLAEAYRSEAEMLDQLEWWIRAPEEARS